jgi:hypothetical protein
VAAQTTKRLLHIFLMATLVSSCRVSRESDATNAGVLTGSDEVTEESPLMVAQVIQVPVGATVREVTGKCILVRDQREGKPLRAGQTLHHGDTFEVDTTCSIVIAIPSQSQGIHLTREQGRFFRIENPKMD